MPLIMLRHKIMSERVHNVRKFCVRAGFPHPCVLSESRIITDYAENAAGGIGDSQTPIQSVLQSLEKELSLPTPIRVLRVIRVFRDSDGIAIIRDSDNTHAKNFTHPNRF